MSYQSVAGQFFPENKKEQQETVRKFLKEAKEVKISGKIKGLIVPHAGWIYSGIVAAAGYKQVSSWRNKNIKNQKLVRSPSTLFGANSVEGLKIILVGPSHREYFSGVKEGIFDHSVEVQIPFLQEVAPKAKINKFVHSRIIPIVYGEITPEDLAREIEKNLDENSIVVISSDLSHFYPYDLAVKIDAAANKYIPELNIKKVESEVEACGKVGISAIIHLAKKKGWKAKLLDYKNSGDTAGGKDSVVGYGCYCFYV